MPFSWHPAASPLWSSWRLQGPRHSAYYSGDTGYAPHFAAIRERFGDVDLTMMKVGAYGETWLDIHMDRVAAHSRSACAPRRRILGPSRRR